MTTASFAHVKNKKDMDRIELVVTSESQLRAVVAEELRRYFSFIQPHQISTDPEYIDYKRCKEKYFSSVPDSTLRQKFANKEIPGVTKIGKRLLIHDQTVASWLQSNRRVNASEIDQVAEEQFARRHGASHRPRKRI